MGLPALANELPEGLRRAYVLSDLAVIADEASKQVVANDYAKAEVTQLTYSLGSLPGVPHARRVHQLYVDFCLSDASQDRRLSMLDIVEAVLEHRLDPIQGMNDTRLGRDVLAQLHPDRQSGGDMSDLLGDDASETTFKNVESARAKGDRLTAQGLYAVTVANIAMTSNLSITQLERARYRAYLAKIASQSRFATTEEVDAWRDRMRVAAPYIARGRALYEVYCVFYLMLSGGEHAKLVLKGRESENIFAGLDAAQEKYRLLVDEEAPLDELTASINITEFDGKFGEIFKHQAKLFKVYDSLGMITDSEASHFSDALIDLCRIPEPVVESSEPPVDDVIQPATESSAQDAGAAQPEIKWSNTDDLFKHANSKKKAESSTASFIRFLDY